MSSKLFILVFIATLLCSCGPKVIIDYQGTSPIKHPSFKFEQSLDEEQKNSPYVTVLSMPTLKGGDTALKKKIHYPEEAIRNGIEGNVSVLFIINKDGSTSDFEVIKSIGHGCDEAVIKAIQESTFLPGRSSQESNANFAWLVSVDFKL